MVSKAGEEASDMDSSNGMLRSDRKGFQFLFRKYYRQLCDYALIYTDSQTEAEDIVQDAFVYLWKNRKTIKLEKDVRFYLFSSVKHEALNILKHKAIEKRLAPSITEFWDNLSRTAYSEEEQEMIRKVQEIIAGLPDQCRTVFRMSCMDCMSYKAIGEALGISVNTVKTHVSKAYRILRESLGSSKDMASILYFFLVRRLTNIKNGTPARRTDPET